MPLFFYTLYIEGEGGTTAGEGEAIVRVHITDANDNRPEFEVEGGELVAAVPTTAEYGHLVTKVQVWFFLPHHIFELNSELFMVGMCH